jgi:predicted TIM-barrel fold metal-dependent hydrolase
MSATDRPSLDDVVAIDVHTHAEVSLDGGDSLPRHLREAAGRHFGGHTRTPDAQDVADYYRERAMMAVVFTVDTEATTGQPRVPNEEVAEVAVRNSDVLIPFASIDPHKGRRGVEEARRLIEAHGVRGFKFHPNLLSFFPNDRTAYPLYEVIAEAGLPALFQHRPQRHRLGPAGRRRDPPEVLEPNARRRRGAHAAQAPGAVRLGLSDERTRTVARGFRAARHRHRGAAS